MSCSYSDQVLAVAAYAPAHRTGRSAQTAGRPPQTQRQLETSRVDPAGRSLGRRAAAAPTRTH
jgi:hypothetical protein